MGSQVKTAARSLETVLAGKSIEWLRGASNTKLALSGLGGVRGFEARTPPVRIVAPSRQDAAPVWHLIVHLAGRGCYRMPGRSVEQRPGAVLLADGQEECSVEHSDGAHVVSWILPG